MTGVKKSDFTAKTTLNDTDTFDFVQNGQNFKITKQALVTALGFVGSIIQKGGVTSVPVLNIDGSVNEIRNLLAGSGIAIETTIDGDNEISHNFINGDGGADIIDDLTASQPVLKNIVAGDGITVSGSSDRIQISVSGSTPVSTNTVIVNEMADFPAPASGIITLADNTQYFVQNNLTTANRFVFGNNCVIAGADAQVASLTYTGSGTMFTAVDEYTKLNDLTISCTSGTFLAWSSTYGNGDRMFINNCIVSAATLGTFSGCDGFSTISSQYTFTTDGFTFSGVNGFVNIDNFVVVATAGIFCDLGTATFDAVSVRNGYAIMSALTYIISGAAASANIKTDALGNVINVRLVGAGSFAQTITAADDLWEFHHNDGIEDSIISILAMHAGATITISAISTPVIVGATWTYDHESRIAGTVGGRMTYSGKGGHTTISASVNAIGVVSQTRDFEFLLYKNGTAITNAVFERGFNNTGAGSLSVVWQEDLVTGDYLELWVQNTESTDNITINSIKLAIQG